MAPRKRLYLYWDPAIDGTLRRQLERALGDLRVDAADGDTIDPDPESPGVVMAFASAAGEWAAPARTDILVQAGPGNFPSANGVFRLESTDIALTSARWTRLLDRLSSKLDMASLALAPEDIEVRLDEAVRQAAAAERALATAQLAESNAIRERNGMEAQLIKSRADAARIQQELDGLRIVADAGAFALGAAPPDRRDILAETRQHAWRAAAAAARATEVAAQLPDVLAWTGGATYAGEHRNGRAHGHGVMTFHNGGRESAVFRGEFVDGRRAGHGVGTADGGLIWSGQWKNDEACGLGVLEAPDGRRFEGEVEPGADGAPRANHARGWEWPSPMIRSRAVMHRETPPALPAPDNLPAPDKGAG